jgi:3-phenylpropionate/trans-cinnamate dioxygenase ferredoxin component
VATSKIVEANLVAVGLHPAAHAPGLPSSDLFEQSPAADAGTNPSGCFDPEASMGIPLEKSSVHCHDCVNSQQEIQMPWKQVARTTEIEDDEVQGVEIGGRQLAVFRIEGQYHVTDNVCTHQYALLSDGYLEDGCIECPLHQARFDIRTGKAMCAPATKDIAVYPVKVDDDRVLAELPE